MTLRRTFAGVGRFLGGVLAAFLPEPGTTEGALYVGLVLIAAGCLVADLVPLALVVPGVVLVILSSLPAFAAFRGTR